MIQSFALLPKKLGISDEQFHRQWRVRFLPVSPAPVSLASLLSGSTHVAPRF